MVAGIAAGLTGSARVHPSCRGSKSDQYERHEKIGEGTYGVVYKVCAECVCVKDGGREGGWAEGEGREGEGAGGCPVGLFNSMAVRLALRSVRVSVTVCVHACLCGGMRGTGCVVSVCACSGAR